MCQHTFSLSWPEREFFCVLIAVQFQNQSCGCMFCHMIHYFFKKFTSVSEHLDTSEAPKGVSFLLLLYQHLWSELLRHISIAETYINSQNLC